jgi:hypothetical protein
MRFWCGVILKKKKLKASCTSGNQTRIVPKRRYYLPYAGLTKTFPPSCPDNKLLGCGRVALTAPHRDEGVKPLFLEASTQAVEEAILEWVKAHPRTTVLYHRPSSAGSGSSDGESTAGAGFMHARFVSFLWGFSDDVYVSWKCAEGGPAAAAALAGAGRGGALAAAEATAGAAMGVEALVGEGEEQGKGVVLVEVQGQLRLGVGDMGVNPKRNRELLRELEKSYKSGRILHGHCRA